jgi:hypothetical protein
VENYSEILQELFSSYIALGCHMPLKLHFLHWHLDFFLENMATVNNEYGKRLHQDVSQLEKRYGGKWSPNMLADYCRFL